MRKQYSLNMVAGIAQYRSMVDFIFITWSLGEYDEQRYTDTQWII